MTFRSYQIRWTSILGALTVAVVLSGCGGGGGGGGARMAMDPTPTPTPNNPMTQHPACTVGGTVSAGSSCAHGDLVFTVSADGEACVGSGICSRGNISVNRFMARPTANGFEITSLPSSDPSTNPPSEPSTNAFGFGIPGSTGDVNGISNAVVNAAGNQPLAGSVTQSSDGQEGVTTDVVKVTVSGNPATGLRYDVNYNSELVVTTERGGAAENVEAILDRAKGTELWERVSGQADGNTWHGIEFYRSLRGTDVSDVPAGDLWVDVYTDYTGEGDTDYLAGGIWVFSPDDATSLDDYEYGAFADGSDPFQQGNILALTGSATYEGDATGVYANRDEGRNYFFDAAATLTANFGTNAQFGTISGMVNRVMVDGSMVDGNPSLTLNSADIGNANSGFFNGDTAMNWNEKDFSGKWGGQFYGNGDAATDHPGSVAGTFGGASTDERESFVGVFGAYKQ